MCLCKVCRENFKTNKQKKTDLMLQNKTKQNKKRATQKNTGKFLEVVVIVS